MNKPELELNDFEKNEPITQKFMKYLDERLKSLRIQNDLHNAPVDIRGRIAEVKSILKKVSPKT